MKCKKCNLQLFDKDLVSYETVSLGMGTGTTNEKYRCPRCFNIQK